MLWLWFADRATALLAYPALVLAAFTGIAHSAKSRGFLHRWARAYHTYVSLLAVLLVLAHGGLGAWDAYVVARGQVPEPSYGLAFFLAGTAIGIGALFLTVVATLAFLDAKRFTRPWSPRLVHAFAYAGFAFATVHAVAIGTDMRPFAAQFAAGVSAFLALAVVSRWLRERAKAPAAAKAAVPDGPGPGTPVPGSGQDGPV